MKAIYALLLALATLLAGPAIAKDAAADTELTPEMVEWLEQLSPKSGKVAIPEAKASLDLGEDYVFYGPVDTQLILIEAWGNPPESAGGVLGLVMPKGTTPFSDSWGAVITYDPVGYVSDEDAADVDYDELLEQMQEGTAFENEARAEAGYPPIQLVGWAARPVYDAKTHSVVWAKDLLFGDAENAHSLNYDLRTLGRHGVLSMNLVSSMSELPGVKAAADTLAKHAAFDPGARYSDFDASTDRVAEFGIGGLVAASAGVAAAKKLGLFAILLKFLKPILIGVAVLLGAFRNRIARLFGFKSGDDYEADWDDGNDRR